MKVYCKLKLISIFIRTIFTHAFTDVEKEKKKKNCTNPAKDCGNKYLHRCQKCRKWSSICIRYIATCTCEQKRSCLQ